MNPTQHKPSLLESSRPNISSKDLPGVPTIKDFQKFDQWIRAFYQYLNVNLSYHVSESVRQHAEVVPTPPEAPVAPDATAKLIHAELIKQHVKDVTQYTRDMKRAFGIMIGQLSISSEELIKRETENYDTVVHGNVLALIDAYRRTHRPLSIGVVKSDQYQAEKSFNRFIMGDLSLDEYNVSFESHIANLKSLEASLPDDEKLVLMYLDKLDRIRYGEFNIYLSNGVLMKSLEYPKDLKSAQRLVSQYRTSGSGSGSHGRASKAVFKAESKIDLSMDSIPKGSCFRYASNGKCNFGDRCKYRHDFKLKSNDVHSAGGSSIPPTIKSNATKAVLLSRSTKNDDIKVILDSGAEASMFQDQCLLCDVRESDQTHVMRGIGSGDVTSCKHGLFLGIFQVHVFDNLNVNILSFSQVVKCGVDIVYDGAKDAFVMETDNHIVNFVRDGDLYTVTIPIHKLKCLMVHRDVSLPKSKVEAMERVFEMSRCCGFASEDKMVSLVESGSNVKFTVKDVRDAFRAFGKPQEYSRVAWPSIMHPLLCYKI